MNRVLGVGAGLLVVLLIVAAVVLSTGRAERATNPSVTNDLPSGLSAFAELLRRDGYEVVVDRRERADVRPGDLVVCSRVVWGSESLPDRLTATLSPFVEKGGRLLHLTFQDDFGGESLAATPLELTPKLPGDQPTTILGGAGDELFLSGFSATLEIGASETPKPAWTMRGGSDVVRADIAGEGAGLFVSNALPLTNRFLGRESNAEWGLGLVRRLQSPGGRVVFAEASFGNTEEQGFLGTVGAWAVAVQWQLILLGLLIAYTLGQRFGLPIAYVPVQRGARELVDAVAMTLQRGRRAPFAARLVGESALDQARGLLGLAPGVARGEVLRRLPDEDREALEKCLDAEAAGISEQESRKRAAHLVDRASGWTRAGLMDLRPKF